MIIKPDHLSVVISFVGTSFAEDITNVIGFAVIYIFTKCLKYVDFVCFFSSECLIIFFFYWFWRLGNWFLSSNHLKKEQSCTSCATHTLYFIDYGIYNVLSSMETILHSTPINSHKYHCQIDCFCVWSQFY